MTKPHDPAEPPLKYKMIIIFLNKKGYFYEFDYPALKKFFDINFSSKNAHSIKVGKILQIKEAAFVVKSMVFDFFLDQTRMYNCRLNVCVDEVEKKELPKDIISIPASVIRKAVKSTSLIPEIE
jgi:hypothetical protein